MKKLKLILLTTFGLLFGSAIQAQISGILTELDGTPIIGASVLQKGTSIGTVSDYDGKFSLNIQKFPVTLIFSYIGYGSQEKTFESSTSGITINMTEGVGLEEIVVTGSRAFGRTNTDTPVPVDVIDVASLASKGGFVSVTEIMNVAAPSFTSQSQTVSDGTDHIDPASLRGLGVDQVLVLINGKRRHNTSLLNVNGTVGAGSVGTDMNSIPSAAIKRIEVLRDGAAAQYGSDAIAGVINIVLKGVTDGLEIGINTGANMSSLGNHQEGGIDGEKLQIDGSFGLPMGEKGGFINITGSLGSRNPALRNATNLEKLFDINNSIERVYLENNPGSTIADMTGDDYTNGLGDLPQTFIDASANEDYNVLDNLELAARNQTRNDYRFKVGTSKLREGKAFVNMSLPMSETSEVYAFGGVAYRKGLAFGFLREPHRPKANTAANPNGFLPGISSDILDKSIAFGIKGELESWSVDLSNTFGSNTMDMTVVNSTNASLGAASPSIFQAGGFGFSQNTTNLDFSKAVSVLSGLNMAFGAEHRMETFEITAGAENSYSTYDNNGIPTVGGVGGATNAAGESLPGTSQVYGGFTPKNAIRRSRNSVAGYADFELDATNKLLFALATRFESFSDFGNTFNYKIASRYKLTDNIAIRSAYSTGFRAPSLHQQFFSRSSTVFDANGVAQEQGLFTNDSRAAQLIGIAKLKEENSQSVSVGLTGKFAGFSITVDAYQIGITDRIVLSGAFGHNDNPELKKLFAAAGAGKARFLVNAVDTKTQGVDIVISHKMNFGESMLQNSLAATFSTNEVTAIKVPTKIKNADLSGAFFDGQEEAFLTLATPRSKVGLTNTFTLKNLNIQLRNTYFGSVTDPNDFDGDRRVEGTEVSADAIYDAKVITDLSLGYKFTDGFSLTLGSNNLLDVYPTENRAGGQSNASFPYSRRTSQFGFMGRYAYLKASFNLR